MGKRIQENGQTIVKRWLAWSTACHPCSTLSYEDHLHLALISAHVRQDASTKGQRKIAKCLPRHLQEEYKIWVPPPKARENASKALK
eukprot:3756279-Amphidinium_carterae.1